MLLTTNAVIYECERPKAGKMSVCLEKRGEQLEKLKEFITATRKRILDITKELQWDTISLNEKKEMVCCPYDKGHIVPKVTLHNHLERCQLKKECYHPEDKLFPPLSVDQSSPSTMKMDKSLQASILRQAKEKNPSMLIGFHGAMDDRNIPMSSDRFMSSLTSDEKAALHSYVISNTVNPCEGKDISLLEQDLEKNFRNKKEEKKEKTPLEKLIEERDAKRRKEGKKVHINRKSHTEIIREVIENQMEIYVEWLKDEYMIKEEEPEPEKMAASDNHSEGEISESDAKTDDIASSNFIRHGKMSDNDERKAKFREEGGTERKEQRRNFYESWRREELQTSRDYQSRSCHSSESGSRKYWHSGKTSYKDAACKYYKDHDYKKFSGKYYVDDRTKDHDRKKISKHSGEKYWDGGVHVMKEEASEGQLKRESKSRKVSVSRKDSRKREREKYHHKSKRRHHSSDSDSDTKYRCKKKERNIERDD